jgi:LPXTG-site transpeptidase (sortase) family protein
MTNKRTNKSKSQANKAKQSSVSKIWLYLNKAGLSLIIVGLIFAGISLFGIWENQHSSAKPKPLSQALDNRQPKDNGQPLISGTPRHIIIPSVGIDLNVIPGYYYPSTNSWTLSPTNAQYAVMTAKANNKEGDTFIYGHALMNVFGKLPKIQPGDVVTITTDTGHTFSYTFQSSTITTPTDTTLFKYRGKPILILQTCSGAWYQNRQLFVFNLSKVS